jgi:hypothetical protein
MPDQHRIGRQTIIFFLPLEMEAFTNDQSPYSSSDNGEVFWDKRQMYINPQSFAISEKKLVKADLTKGGYVVQYWGEDLPTIQVNGTTGSAGIEGINILRSIYRHEQTQFRRVLMKRQRAMAEAAAQDAKDAANNLLKRKENMDYIISYKRDSGQRFTDPETVMNAVDDAFGSFSNVSDLLTGGAFSQVVNGVSNSIDLIFGSNIGSRLGGPAAFKSTPTLAAFATNIDLYYQGEFFRGYFTSFTTTESATQAGLFDYNFGFTVTRRTGKRTNFMPWHRNPLSHDGEAKISMSTTEAKGQGDGIEELSFPPINSGNNIGSGRLASDERNSVGPTGFTSSKFEDAPEAEQDPNSVPIKRRGSF